MKLTKLHFNELNTHLIYAGVSFFVIFQIQRFIEIESIHYIHRFNHLKLGYDENETSRKEFTINKIKSDKHSILCS